jgi:predicted transcriptional regulator
MTAQQQVIGIAPEAVVRERILAIARGHYHPQPDEPKTWYASLDAVPKTVLATHPKIIILSNKT